MERQCALSGFTQCFIFVSRLLFGLGTVPWERHSECQGDKGSIERWSSLWSDDSQEESYAEGGCGCSWEMRASDGLLQGGLP